MPTTKLAIILGTRPEIIKLTPLIRECDTMDVEYSLIHTGQHYSDTLDSVFFDQLQLPEPEYNLQTGSNTQGQQTGEMLIRVEEILREISPDCVVVQGDTNSTLAGALATSKLPIELGHVEAGLRSYDRAMPEETNRVITDHVSDYLFPPTEEAAENLSEEGIPDERIVVTGNPIVDSVYQHRELALERSTILSEVGVKPGEFALLTAHRAENVDNEETFRNILRGVGQYAQKVDIDVIFPAHPRAEKNIQEFDLTVPSRIRTVPPQDFLDFLQLEMDAAVVFTDSGGVQEETCILRSPCVTVRTSTERPETVEAGANIVAGTNPDSIEAAAETMSDRQTDWDNPFGDGETATRILHHILSDNSHSDSV